MQKGKRNKYGCEIEFSIANKKSKIHKELEIKVCKIFIPFKTSTHSFTKSIHSHHNNKESIVVYWCCCCFMQDILLYVLDIM